MKQSTPLSSSQGQKDFSSSQLSSKRAGKHRSKKRSLQRLTKFAQMHKSSKVPKVTPPTERERMSEAKFQETLGACLRGYKARRIYNNPVILCYRRQYKILEAHLRFLQSHWQAQSFSHHFETSCDEKWTIARQKTQGQLKRCRELFQMEYDCLCTKALWLKPNTTSKYGLDVNQLEARTEIISERIKNEQQTLAELNAGKPKPGPSLLERTVVNLFDDGAPYREDQMQDVNPSSIPFTQGYDRPIRVSSMENFHEELRSPSPMQKLQMKPVERPEQEDYLSINNSFTKVKPKDAAARKSKVRRLKSNRKTASAMKSRLNEPDSEGDAWNQPRQKSPPRVIHQSQVQQPAVVAKASKTLAPSPTRENSVSPFPAQQSKEKRGQSPATSASGLRKSHSLRMDDPILRQLTAATKARLEPQTKKLELALGRNAQPSEQPLGIVVKALTRVNSRSTAVIEELPSNRKAASVTATPTKAAGPTEAAKSVRNSKAEQSGTAKKLAVEPSDSSVKNENLQNLPRYMRPLNRQVRDLAKQMESVRERVQSLRTSLHSRGSKKGSVDRNQLNKKLSHGVKPSGSNQDEWQHQGDLDNISMPTLNILNGSESNETFRIRPSCISMHSAHTPLRKSVKSSTRASARPILQKEETIKSVTRDEAVKKPAKPQVMTITTGQNLLKNRTLSPYSPSKKFNSPNKENLPRKQIGDSISPANTGNMLIDQSEKEDISPLLQFQSPSTAKYQSVPIDNINFKNGKVLSGRNENSVNYSVVTRQSIGGGNTEVFTTAKQGIIYAEEPQLEMVSELQPVAEDSIQEQQQTSYNDFQCIPEVSEQEILESQRNSQASAKQSIGPTSTTIKTYKKKKAPLKREDDGRKSFSRRLRGQRCSKSSSLYVTPISNKNGGDPNADDHDENEQIFQKADQKNIGGKQMDGPSSFENGQQLKERSPLKAKNSSPPKEEKQDQMSDLIQLMKIQKSAGLQNQDLSGLDNLDKDQLKLVICNLLQKLQD